MADSNWVRSALFLHRHSLPPASLATDHSSLATRRSPLFRAVAVCSIRGEPGRAANRQAFPSSPYQAILHGLLDRQIERISFRGSTNTHRAPLRGLSDARAFTFIPNWKRASARSRHTQFTARLPDSCERLRKMVSSCWQQRDGNGMVPFAQADE